MKPICLVEQGDKDCLFLINPERDFVFFDKKFLRIQNEQKRAPGSGFRAH